MAEERLQKLLARAGLASRRAAEQLITSGAVKVNGQVVRELGAKADPARDRIEVDGRPVAREEPVYFVVNKPRGIVTTLQDPEGRPTLAELLQEIPARVYPVGRLDFHTSGALLVTNDGDLAQALLHPSRGVPKTYVAKLSLQAEPRMLDMLRSGVELDDGYRTAPAQVDVLRVEDGKTWLEITITEGKNRQIHRMVEAVGARVMRLSRTHFAGLSTEDLRPGQVRPLSEDELMALRKEYLGIEPVYGRPAPKSAARRDSRGERPRNTPAQSARPAPSARTAAAAARTRPTRTPSKSRP
jgi:23S rRNA pseudouridine2605 synthase